MSNALTAKQSAMALPVVADDLNGYLSKISSITLLSAEEEQALARNLRDNEDIDAARSLVMSQLRFVVHIARTYKGYGLPLADLVQEGNIGLMKAVKRFDPDKNVRLISFAVHWIRAEIHEYVIRNWRIVKVATTKSQRKLFFKLRSAKKQLNWLSQAEVWKWNRACTAKTVALMRLLAVTLSVLCLPLMCCISTMKTHQPWLNVQTPIARRCRV